MNEPAPLSELGISEALGAMLAGKRPSDPAAYRKHILESYIFPMIERWGFDKRSQEEHANWHAEQETVYRKMKRRLTGCGAIVVLTGERGLGKTTLAARFAIETAWANHAESLKDSRPRNFPHVVYRKAARLIARYKPLYADYGTTETDALLESLDFLCQQQEFLVIDEVHDCDDQKMKTRVLTDLIDRRYAACRDTILIANQTPEDFAASIGDSVLSRLNEHGAILPCAWPSYRIQ